MTLFTALRSPREAHNVFVKGEAYPRQRNVFMVRFVASSFDTPSALTFAVKTVDRPKVNPKTEELNQYNKRRQVYTGYKLEPIRMDFYDSKDGAAQRMWRDYSRYYFGDFAPNSDKSYQNYDMTTGTFQDNAPNGFGFTGANGGDRTNIITDPAAQFYFSKIEIYHFHGNEYDQYDLINPRITNFEPDQLDYEQSGIAMIHVALVYENLQYHPALSYTSINNDWSEFTTGFFGDTVIYPDLAGYSHDANESKAPLQNRIQIGSILNNAANAVVPREARFTNTPSTGVLGSYGNFVYGPSTGTTPSNLGNSAFQASLELGSGTTSSTGISGTTGDMMQALATQATSGYGNVSDTLVQGLMASAALGSPNFQSNNVVYTPQVYGTINSQQTGTAQYGYNVG